MPLLIMCVSGDKKNNIISEHVIHTKRGKLHWPLMIYFKFKEYYVKIELQYLDHGRQITNRRVEGAYDGEQGDANKELFLLKRS